MALAISLLRTAALKAQSEKRERIEITDLEETYHHESNPSDLVEDERILLEILRERRRLSSSELFELYVKRASDPRGERSFRNYMESLCAKGLARAVGANRWREYQIAESEKTSSG